MEPVNEAEGSAHQHTTWSRSARRNFMRADGLSGSSSRGQQASSGEALRENRHRVVVDVHSGTVSVDSVSDSLEERRAYVLSKHPMVGVCLKKGQPLVGGMARAPVPRDDSDWFEQP